MDKRSGRRIVPVKDAAVDERLASDNRKGGHQDLGKDAPDGG